MGPLAFIGLCILCIVLGTITGIATGLVPGIHTNTVAAILVVLHGPLTVLVAGFFDVGSLPQIELALICYLVSVAMAHIFVSYIPATFLGAPEEGTALSVLPAHRLLLQGRGLTSIRLTAQGGLAAVFICVIAAPALRFIMGSPVDIYDRTRPFIPLFLLLLMTLMIMTEGRSERGARTVREPRTCLLVEEVRYENTMSGANFFEVWALWGLKGKRVVTKGLIEKKGGRMILSHRGEVELVFEAAALHSAVEGSIGRQAFVKGAVCQRIEPPRRDGSKRMAWALALIVVSGALGLVLLDAPGLSTMNFLPMTMLGLPAWGWQFAPLFTGLFGLPTLLASFSSKPAIPSQLHDPKEQVSGKGKARGILFGTAAGAFLGWFPATSSAECALLASQASADAKGDEESGGDSTEEFMVTVSSINTAHTVANFVALFVILRTRSGAAKATQDILGSGLDPWNMVWPAPWQLGLVLASILASSVIAYFMTLRLAKVFTTNFHRIPYKKLVASVIVLLVAIVFLMSGPLGLGIMVVATFLGTIPATVGVRRVHLMGCLIVPVLASWTGMVVL